MRTYKSKNQLLIFLAVGFFVGILYQNIFYMKNEILLELFDEQVLQQYLQMDIAVEQYGVFVLKERILVLGILLLLGCGRWKKAVMILSVFILGGLGGILTVTAMLQYGMKGMLLCLAGGMPHGIFYGLLYGILGTYWYEYPKRQWNRAKTIFVIILFLLGVITEVYVNPVVWKMVIKML